MFDIRATITAAQKLQDDNLRKAALLETGGAIGRTVLAAGLRLHRAAVGVTHVDTGTLRASHRIDFGEVVGQGAMAVIFIDPRTVNPGSGNRPSEYGIYEHRRGGEHAFYSLAMAYEAANAGAAAVGQIQTELRGG